MNAVFVVAMGCLVFAPLAPLATLPGATAASRWARLGARSASVISAIGCVLLVAVGFDAALSGSIAVVNLGSWLGFGHSALRADGLAGIFLALTGIAGAATAIVYAEAVSSRGRAALASLLLLACATAIGADNAFLFLLAWEGLAVCIFLLTSAGAKSRADLLSGYLTAGLNKIGGAALLAAFGLLYGHTHSFSFVVWAHADLDSATKAVACLLFLIAFGSKVGLLPVQGGLPAGYSAAGGYGAASLSVALSAGFYGIWRFDVSTLSPLPTWCGDAFLILGTITAITGIVYAVTQDRLRRFLGYSTIENAGIVMLGLGVALLGQAANEPKLAAVGLLAATLHVCGHNLAKTLALIGTVNVERSTGEDSLRPLGGLGRHSPLTAAGLGIASLTLCAIPPLAGFVSEWFTFEALLQGFRMPTLLSQLLCALAAAGLAFTAGIGLLAFAKFYGFIFLGERREQGTSRPDAGTARIGLGLLAFVLLFLGAAAPWEVHLLGSGLASTLGLNPATTAISHPLVLGPVFPNFSVLAPTWLMLVLPGYALLAFAFGRYVGGRRPVRRAPVWVTGSAATLAAVQYRPSAYSNPMRVVLRGPLGFRSLLVDRAAGVGENGVRRAPHPELQTSVVLAVDRYLYQPLARLALAANSLIRRLQSGRLSAYLFYMLVALISALVLIPVLH